MEIAGSSGWWAVRLDRFRPGVSAAELRQLIDLMGLFIINNGMDSSSPTFGIKCHTECAVQQSPARRRNPR